MSTNGNGHKSPIPFQARQDVPIVGQPFTLKGWFIQLIVTCNCSLQSEPLLILGQVGAVSGPCPKCRRRLVLQGVNANRNGDGFDLNIGALPAEPEASSPGEPSDV